MNMTSKPTNGYGHACLLLITLVFAAQPVLAGPEADWQVKRLFSPNEAQRQNERNGRIFIYDSLTDTVAQQAVDEQFERVENMMFINTIVTDEAGEPVPDPETGAPQTDDGC